MNINTKDREFINKGFAGVKKDFQKGISGLKVEIGEVKKDVGELKKDVSELKKDVGELKKDVGELKEDVGELKEDVGELKEDVGELKEDVAGIKTEMVSMESRLSTSIKTEIEKLAQMTQEQFLIVHKEIAEINKRLPTSGSAERLKVKVASA